MSKRKGREAESWWTAIEQAEHYRSVFSSYSRWSTFRDYYRGKFPGYAVSPGKEACLPYNLTFMMARIVVPSVYFRNPYIMVSPRNFMSSPDGEAAVRAKVMESVDNWLLQEMEVKRAMKDAALDCFFCGRGIIKIGYEGELVDEEGSGLERVGEVWSETSDTRAETPRRAGAGMPWWIRVEPDLFLVPPCVRSLKEAEWVDHIVLKRLDAVKASGLYGGRVDRLEGTHLSLADTLTSKKRMLAEMGGMEKVEWVELHEIRDAEGGELLTLVPGKDPQIIRGPLADPLQVDGLPFADFCFYDDPEFYWCPSFAQLLEPSQLEMNEVNTQALCHRRLALCKFIAQQGMIDPSEVEKMLGGYAGPVVWSKGKPGESVTVMQPHIPPDLMAWKENQRGDVREMFGIGKIQAGEIEVGGRRTAEEVRTVQAAHDLRMSDLRDSTADCLSGGVRKTNQIILSLWSKERVTQVVGYDGAKYWVRYTPEQLRAEYDLKVDVESMAPATKMMRRREMVELVQALGNNPRANLDYLLRALLREYDWVDVMKMLPEAPEMATGPMGMEQYAGMQQRMLAEPQTQLRPRAAKSAAALSLKR